MMNKKEQVKSLKESIYKANKTINDAVQKIRTIQSECSHEDVKIYSWGTAECKICGKEFDWYCPTSPTLECDYEQEDGSYDEDCCRYCGKPEERK
jgi:hypothetical protein